MKNQGDNDKYIKELENIKNKYCNNIFKGFKYPKCLNKSGEYIYIFYFKVRVFVKYASKTTKINESFRYFL